MILWKFTLREVKSRPGRATLTLLSIVIGVAAVVAVTVGTSTTHQAYQKMYESVAGRAAFEVVAEGGGFFDKNIARRIGQIPGVKAAVPSVQKVSALWHKKNHVRLLVLGIDPTHDEAVRDYELEEGKFFSKKYDALLETGFARGLGVSVGDEVKLGTSRGGLSGGLRKLRVTGLLSPRGAAGFNQGGVIFLPLKTAEYLYSQLGNINTISIVLEETADEKAISAEIAGFLPTGLTVRSPMARSQLAKETVQDAEKGLNFAYALMIVLAIFTIFNTFLMNVGERRRQLAVLRAVGTTRSQVTRMLLIEGLAMGFVGTVLGSLLGLGGAYVLTQAMGQVYSTAMPALRITPGPFILAALLGPGISLVAMFIPAHIAGKISPLEGMRFIASEGQRRVSFRYILFSLSFFILTGSMLAGCITGYLPIELTVFVGAVFTAAFVLLVPIVLGGLAWLAATALYPILGVEGRIAQRQILRRRVRTTLTIGLLYIAVSTAISLGTTILNCVEDIRSWQAKTMKGDFFIRALAPDLATGTAPPMPEELGNKLREIEGVTNIDSIRYVSASMQVSDPEPRKQSVLVFVRDFTDKGELPLDIQDGNPAEVRRQLEAGEVVLGTVLANRTNTKVGDQITLDTDKGPKTLRVAATSTVYLVGGMVIYMEGKTARRLLGVEDVNVFIVNTTSGMLAAVQGQLKPICDKSGLMLHSFADLRKRVDDLMTGVIASLWGLLALGFIVGAFGIANTLTMNVLEQTRELALLRVVAMTRWQVRKTILAQALIIGFIGLTLGVAGGVIGSYVSNLCAVPLLGHSVDFVLHPSLLAICFALGLVVIIVAAWLPAERAARLNLLIALQYE
ncbi:MAG: ABC transporter permease [Planctomycetes bacterium]|nr:ABC transporter permease [Planctomycetota bacterium]MBU4399669.1 ABC transporter permease [Planctomycetota bacterium]MCG2685723.1 ABC transporter permease [Planctomycetales bacterium]